MFGGEIDVAESAGVFSGGLESVDFGIIGFAVAEKGGGGKRISGRKRNLFDFGESF